MALPKKTEALLIKRLELIDDSVDSFIVEDIEKKIFKELSRYLIKELDLDKDGNIKKSIKNLRVVNKIKNLRSIVFTDGYKAKVGKYISSFDKVRDLSNQYIKEL